MNEIKLKVNFTKRTCVPVGVPLTVNDYNSTKLVFDFDRDNGIKVFEMINPSGNLAFVKEVQNNEIVLVGETDVTTVHEEITYIKYLDTNENVYWYDQENEKLYDSSWIEVLTFDINNYTKVTKECSIFSESGYYTFEISLYDGDSKLTSAKGKLRVKEEAVVIDGELAETYLPIFDDLLTDVSEALNNMSSIVTDATGATNNANQAASNAVNAATSANTAAAKANNVNIDATRSTDRAYITITDSDGTQKTVEVKDSPVTEQYVSDTINNILGSINYELSKLTTLGDDN